jgi:hypothetical protein
MTVKTVDSKEWNPAENKLVGSVDKPRYSRDVHRPARVGEFPVFVELSGSYRLFTYSKKLAEV